MPSPTPSSVPPFEVVKFPGAFTSKLVATQDLPAGTIISDFSLATLAKRAYSTVQISKDQHVELNSNLVYTNHSCKPNLEFRVASGSDGRPAAGDVVTSRKVAKGEMLTYFYPSSEWEMDQNFQCMCGEKECLGRIEGAKDMDESLLRRYWINPHIQELLDTRKGSQ